jgi:hypothetical protein
MLLPVTKIPESLKYKFKSFGFVNSYLFANDDDKKYGFEVIYLRFKPFSYDAAYAAFAAALTNNENFIEEYDLKKETVYVFRIPRKLRTDFYLFLKGKYSKLSDSYKKHFPMERYFRGPVGEPMKEPSSFHQIFTKAAELKKQWEEKLGVELDPDQELYDKVNKDKETL